jgi:hypothetical protein
MDQMVHQYERSGHGSDQQNEYESRLMKQDRPVFQEFYIELDRLLNFLTLREGYMTENSSPERLAEVIRRLEREVFGKARLKYPRVAKVRLGEIHCLSEHTDAYEADHKKAAASLAAELEDEMRALLATL